jgi:hypothetical protein
VAWSLRRESRRTAFTSGSATGEARPRRRCWSAIAAAQRVGAQPCRGGTEKAVCGWPPNLQGKFRRSDWSSLAVVCPAFQRGATAAGPDGCPQVGASSASRV